MFILELMSLNYAAFKAENRHEACKSSSAWPFIRSQRGAPLLLQSGYVYRCERRLNSRTYWLCIRYKGLQCNARVILNGNQLYKSTAHNHDMDERSNESNIELKDLDGHDIDAWLRRIPKQKTLS